MDFNNSHPGPGNGASTGPDAVYNGPNGAVAGLETGFSNLSVGKKKKRSARAYHTDLTNANQVQPQNGFGSAPEYPKYTDPGLGYQNGSAQPQGQFAGQLPFQPLQTPPIGQPAVAPIGQPPVAPMAPVASVGQMGPGYPGQTPGQPSQAPGQPLGQTALPMAGPGQQSSEPSSTITDQRYRDQYEYVTPTEDSIQTKPFLTFENIVSPTAGTQYQTFDQGTAASKFIRSTMYNVPDCEQLRQASKLPVAVTIRPFAPLLATEEPIPVVDMTQLGAGHVDPDEVGPIRCRRCRTYMNISMQHAYGNKFTCNICLFPNNIVPADYSAMLDPMTGRRVDSTQRPELSKGVYDIMVPPNYNVGEEEPNVMHHVILVDITVESLKRQLPVVISDAIRSLINEYAQVDSGYESDAGAPETQVTTPKVAIILFDKRVHFFNLSKTLDSTQITISSDLEDPFIPFFDGLFTELDGSMAIEDALNHMERLSSDDTLRAESEPCFSAALRTAMLCLAEVGGGKITSILSSLPSWGPGALSFKDNKTQAMSLSPEVQKQVYTADSDYYKLLAKDFLKNNVGLDCLVVSTAAVDLSNIGWLCTVTGGTVYRWSNYNYERDGRELLSRFTNSITKSRGYQGQLKLRCSNGLQVSQYYGTSSSVAEVSVIGASTQDPVIPVLSEDQAFTVLLEYDGKLSTGNDCHFQAALLYTDQYGVRKVRVINLILAVTESLDQLFTFVDQDAVVTTIVRDTLSFVGKQTFKELRESVNNKLVEVFTQYRAKSELGGHKLENSGKLLMPDSLVNLPLYLLSFLKSVALRDNSHVTADSRLEDIYQMLSMPIERLMYHLYPGLVELHSLYPNEGTIPETDNPSKFVIMPKFKSLLLSTLEAGVYILCDGRRVLVWIRPEANPLLIQDLFGDHVQNFSDIDAMNDELPDLPTEISTQARNLITFFNREICGLNSDASGVQIIRESIDGSDIFFKEHLVEDGSKMAVNVHSANYSEFITRLYNAIKTKLENDKSYKKVQSSLSTAEHHETLAQRYINF